MEAYRDLSSLETPPPRRLKPFALYDRRESPTNHEMGTLLLTINNIFTDIVRGGEAMSPSPKNEIEIAEEIADLKLMQRTERALENLEGRANKRDLTITQRASATEKLLLQRELNEKWSKPRTINEAEEEKKRILGKGMQTRLTGEGSEELRAMIIEILLLIQKERKRQGLPQYPQEGIRMLIYEIVYEDYLWRNETRNDGKTSYLRTHLRAAVINHIKQGFTGLPSLLTALKHDSIEDLLVHKKNCKDVKERDYKPDWLFCDELYVHYFDDAIILDDIKQKAQRTIEDLTSPPDEDNGEKGETAKRMRDEQKAKKYLGSVLENGFAATTKMIEQVQNAQTITGVSPSRERQAEKLALIITLHGLFAKVQELKRTDREIIGAGIDFFQPRLRTWFIELQKERMRERLSFEKKAADGHTLLGKLFTKRNKSRPENLQGWTDEMFVLAAQGEAVEARRTNVRRQVENVFKPAFTNVVGIKVVPTPLEEYVDVDRLMKDPDYQPEITPDDPMCEVCVLVKDQKDVWRVACEIMKRIEPDQKSTLDPEVPAGDHPNRGITIELIKHSLGGKIKIRVNGEKAEAEGKRGLRVDRKKPIPEWLRTRVATTLKEAEISGRPVLEVAKEILLKRTISCMTDEGKRERIYLTDGATFMDFAAALPTDKAKKALLYGIRAFRRDTDGRRVEVDLLDRVKQDDICYIEIDDSKPQLDLGHLAFAESERTLAIARTAWNDLAEKERTTTIEKSRTEATIQRAEAYLAKIQKIFGITQPETAVLATMRILKIARENIEWTSDRYRETRNSSVQRIGSGSFDPLKAFARYMDRNQGCSVTLIVHGDHPGVLGEIGLETKKHNINISRVQQDPAEEGKTTLHLDLEAPDTVQNHTLLKMLLKLSYKYEVQLDPKIFTFNNHAQFSAELGAIEKFKVAA